MVDMAKTQIAPAVEKYAADIARNASAKKALDSSIACVYETSLVKKLSAMTDTIAVRVEALEDVLLQLHKADGIIAESEMIRDTVLLKMSELRQVCDEAETITEKSYWPYPTYGDLLFGVK